MFFMHTCKQNQSTPKFRAAGTGSVHFLYSLKMETDPIMASLTKSTAQYTEK